jgi:hypothetical protein
VRYLGRYTHRVAISNHRLLAFDGEHVTFRWKNYAHGGKHAQMKLGTCEFLRRFFRRTSWTYRLALASRCRKLSLAACTCRIFSSAV